MQRRCGMVLGLCHALVGEDSSSGLQRLDKHAAPHDDLVGDPNHLLFGRLLPDLPHSRYRLDGGGAADAEPGH